MDPNNINTDSQMDVEVRNPQSVVFSGKANSITSVTEAGPFDILPMHENFISLIKKNIIIHQKGNKDIEIPIDEGIMKVFENNVSIFLGFESIKE